MTETDIETIDTRTAPFGALLLRTALGAMYIVHGLVLKVMTFTLPGTAKFFASLGFPEFVGYAIPFIEIAGGIALIVGLQVRAVSLALLPILLGAIWFHAGNGCVFSAQGGGWEYPLFLAVISIVQVFIGRGAYALSGDMALPLLPASAR